MTITIDDPWRLLVCTVLAVAVFALSLSVFVMGMWSPTRAHKLVSLGAAAAGVAGAVALVMAGGGWL